MMFKPMVLVLLLLQGGLIAFQAHALMTGRLDPSPTVVSHIKSFVSDLQMVATWDTQALTRAHVQHVDLPPEILRELSELNEGYHGRALRGVKNKLTEVAVIFQNPMTQGLANGTRRFLVTEGSRPNIASVSQDRPISLNELRLARLEARAIAMSQMPWRRGTHGQGDPLTVEARWRASNTLHRVPFPK